MTGTLVSVNNSNAITIQNTDISSSGALCMNLANSSGVLINANTLTSCEYGVYVAGTEANITNNSLSGTVLDAITVSSSLPVLVSGNTITNTNRSAILYGYDTDIAQNLITSSCLTNTNSCGAIKNETTHTGLTLATITENSIKDVGSGLGNNISGIVGTNLDGLTISSNGIINAEHAIALRDSANTVVSGNTLVSSRKHSFSLIQTATGMSNGNTLNTNTLVQRAPDYPYVEVRDEVPGSGEVSGLLSASANNFYPLYKPNTSYVRLVKYGGETTEYDKTNLNTWDPSLTKFEYFAYKPYVNTGSYATANLLINGTFETDVSGWSTSAETGGAPSLSHNVSGSYS
jgi:parallel beta-helix repeat protein